MKIVQCDGGGMLFWWQLGAISQIKDIDHIYAVSCGAITGAVYLCGIPYEVLSSTAAAITPGTALLNEVYPHLRTWPNTILPMDAHLICTDKLSILHRHIYSLRTRTISKFVNRADLIDTILMAVDLPISPDQVRRILHNQYMDHITNPTQVECRLSPYTDPQNCTWDAMTLPTVQEARVLYERGCCYVPPGVPPLHWSRPLVICGVASMCTILSHMCVPTQVAKSILPTGLALYAIAEIWKDPSLLKEPFGRRVDFTNAILMYIGHTLGDIAFIRDSPTLVLHHTLTLGGALAALLNPGLRAMTIALLASEVYPMSTVIMVYYKARWLRSVRLLFVLGYRLPLMARLVHRSRHWFLRCTIYCMLVLEVYWLYGMVSGHRF